MKYYSPVSFLKIGKPVAFEVEKNLLVHLSKILENYLGRVSQGILNPTKDLEFTASSNHQAHTFTCGSILYTRELGNKTKETNKTLMEL